ncbi:unnamed protein product, partial [marine sediment metagenome]
NMPEKIKKKYNPSNQKIILFTGRMIPDKNPDKLILSFPKIKKHFPRAKIIFVGPIDKQYKKELLNLIPAKFKKDLIFTGSLHPVKDVRKIFSFYKIADVFVSIGSWEGLPTRIIEALSQNTPVIAYASGGSKQYTKKFYQSF